MIELTREDRHWIALTIHDAAAEHDLGAAARLIEARISVLIDRYVRNAAAPLTQEDIGALKSIEPLDRDGDA